MEKLIGLFSVMALVFAVSFAGSSAIGAQKPAPTPVVQRPLDAKALLKKLETLEGRLGEAQASIDVVLAKLPNTDDTERDATRVRLDVLYRLESGLQADIAHTREQLAHLP